MVDKWIKHISGIIPYTNKSVDIDLDDKNLIITGTNGAGKTSLLRSIFEKTIPLLIVEKNVFFTIRKNEITVIFSDHIPIKPSNIILRQNAIIQYYEDFRNLNIADPGDSVFSEPKDRQLYDSMNLNSKIGNYLENCLLKLKIRRSFALTEEGQKTSVVEEIDAWFDEFEHNLKILFEDDTTQLHFDTSGNKPRFFIKQNNKPEYKLQDISAGYRAIFDIYSDLLMRADYFTIKPSDLTGVVFIDEIDSHLHVSLQRLILPFFTQSFPQIQFIVTTHSPFVLMSTQDTIIFDLAKNEPITEDLSYYTYSAVMKGLWNVKPIAVSLENNIREIAEIVNAQNKDFARLSELITKIKNYQEALEPESKAFFLLGLEVLEEQRDRV